MEDSIFLLSKEEYEKYKDKIPNISIWWWLRSTGGSSNGIICIRCNGFICDHVNNDYIAVRPALKISSIKSLRPFTNNSFFALGATWKIIDEDLAIAEMPIMYSRFDAESNDYEKSEVKRKLLDWYKERKDL